MCRRKINGFSDLILSKADDFFGLADALCIFELKAPETAFAGPSRLWLC
jgi:hypothetical protein